MSKYITTLDEALELAYDLSINSVYDDEITEEEQADEMYDIIVNGAWLFDEVIAKNVRFLGSDRIRAAIADYLAAA